MANMQQTYLRQKMFLLVQQHPTGTGVLDLMCAAYEAAAHGAALWKQFARKQYRIAGQMMDAVENRLPAVEKKLEMSAARALVIEAAILMRNANHANSKHLEDCLPCQTNDDCKEGMALYQAFVDSQIALDGAIEKLVAEEGVMRSDGPRFSSELVG